MYDKILILIHFLLYSIHKPIGVVLLLNSVPRNWTFQKYFFERVTASVVKVELELIFIANKKLLGPFPLSPSPQPY